MIVMVHADHNIEKHEGLTDRVTTVVEAALSHRRDRISRVEVHVSDENSDKKEGESQMRCMMEARIEGRHPLAVTHHESTVNEAIDGAADKLVRLIDHTLGRAHDIAVHSN